VKWLGGFGADMIHNGRIVEIKKKLSQNNMYKALIQVESGFRELEDKRDIKEKAVYVTEIKDDKARRYWKKYSRLFDVELFIVNENTLEKIELGSE
jgi:hypothetical protein